MITAIEMRRIALKLLVEANGNKCQAVKLAEKQIQDKRTQMYVTTYLKYGKGVCEDELE